jgi:hypothetical protein
LRLFINADIFIGKRALLYSKKGQEEENATNHILAFSGINRYKNLMSAEKTFSSSDTSFTYNARRDPT